MTTSETISWRKMTSRYRGNCCVCGNSIDAGEPIYWTKRTGARHEECDWKEVSDSIHLHGGSGNRCDGWAQGQIVHHKDGRYLYVIRARSEYIAEDGLSFGVGDDSGYVYSAVCREATDDEAAPLKEQERERAAAVEALKRRNAIFRDILDNGTRAERVDGKQVSLDGDELLVNERDDYSRIYGGGRWFVLTKDRVYAVQNNGADGDDWSRNTIRTGGAGAYGSWVPRTEEISSQLLVGSI